MANKDFYDRIADALEIISGDDSHVDDVDKNMDYYKRIAEALENIANTGGSHNENLLVVNVETSSSGDPVLDKTWQEIYDAPMGGIVCQIDSVSNEKTFAIITRVFSENSVYSVAFGEAIFYTEDPDDYPYYIS